MQSTHICAGPVPLIPVIPSVSRWTATNTLMTTATLLHPAAARASTMPTASATFTTPRPTPKPPASTSTAITSMVVAIILACVTHTGTVGSATTEGPVIIMQVVVINEVEPIVVITAIITILVITEQAEK